MQPTPNNNAPKENPQGTLKLQSQPGYNPYGKSYWNNQYMSYPYYSNYPYQNMNYMPPQMGQMPMYPPNYYGKGFAPYYEGEPFKHNDLNNENFAFQNEFPRVCSYSKDEDILKVFPHYKEINNPSFDPDKLTHSDFFILRSTNDDDIHKAIKYQKWTSSAKNNEALSRIWKENNAKAVPVPIFLFFSVVKSQQFLGVAQMTSDFDPKDSFKYWWEECKWFGSFSLKWIYVKDVREKQFEHIRDNGTPITSFTDGIKISDKSGKQMLNIFKNQTDKPNIFSAFAFMDRREDQLHHRDRNPEFLSTFARLSNEFALNPSAMRGKPYKKPYLKSSEKHLSDGVGLNKPFTPTHTLQELHEMFNVTTAGKPKKDKDKKKSKGKKKNVKNEDTVEYSTQGAVKGDIVESSSEEEENSPEVENSGEGEGKEIKN